VPRARIGDIELHYEERGSGEPPLLLIAGIPAVASDWAYTRLPQITAPTLILTGDDDQVIPAASSDVLHERIPGSRLELIEGSGHLFFIERPEATLELLESFL
jgi:pimeloyl-ACP methyl ester carboxylesterase